MVLEEISQSLSVIGPLLPAPEQAELLLLLLHPRTPTPKHDSLLLLLDRINESSHRVEQITRATLPHSTHPVYWSQRYIPSQAREGLKTVVDAIGPMSRWLSASRRCGIMMADSRIGVCRAAGIDRDRAESLASRCDQHREARASQSHGRKNLMPCADGRVDGCMTAAAVGSTAAMIEVRLSDGRVGKKGRHPRLRIVNWWSRSSPGSVRSGSASRFLQLLGWG